MRFSSFFAISGLAVTLGSAAAILPRQDAGGFEITYTVASKPSARPGSSQYCDVEFNVTDPITQTKTRCEGQHGPCVSNDQDPPKPEKPLDADHPATCADTSFTFYLNSYEGVTNYSYAITHAAENGTKRFGVTNLINKENYAGYYHYSCGGSGFCNSYVGDTIINAPFVSQ